MQRQMISTTIAIKYVFENNKEEMRDYITNYSEQE